MDKMKMETPDFTRVNVEKIAELFPNVVTEAKDEQGNLVHKVDFEKLKQELSADVIDGDESYDFTWVGKKSAMVEANKPTNKTLRPCLEDSVNWDSTENLYIEGDNLEVLKLLQESYLNKIKMIYIDPPYNTGNDSFIYPDDYATEKELYDSEVGAVDDSGYRMFKNTETNGRFHSSWCSMMYPRLKLARNLLTEDGVIFISIDDNEVENLKKMCDEAFGSMNFVASVSVNRTSEVATSLTIQKIEYCLVYAKEFSKLKILGNKKYTISRGTVGNADQTMPEITFPKGLKCKDIKDGIYNTTRKIEGSRENIENLTPIIVENGRLKENIVLKARWRSSNDMRNFFNNQCKPTEAKINGIIEEIYIEGDRFMPQIKKLTTEKLSSLYLDNKRGSKDLENLGLGNYFSFPKAVSLEKDFVGLFSNKDSIILDFFSGSATTAHAVMQLNAEDNSNRKFIMVQLPEVCDEKSEAYKAGYKNICEIGKERIRRAGKKIVEETGKTDLDIGFRVLKLDDSNMKDVYYTPDSLTQQDLVESISNIKDGRSGYDLLYQCMLDWGLELSLSHKIERINNNEVHIVNDGDLVACFDDKISEETVKQIADLKPLRVVFRDSSFATPAARINVDEIFKLKSPHTTIKVL